MANYPPFRVWIQTTGGITDDASVSVEKFRGADGEGIVFPLDPAQIDDEAVEAVAKACERYNGTMGSITYNGMARAALAALLAHYAEGE